VTSEDAVYLLQKFYILWLLEVLQVAQVGNKLGLVEVLLRSEVIEIDRICKALHELGEC